MIRTIVIGILLLSLGASAQYKSVFTRESVVKPDTIRWFPYQLYACDSLGKQITTRFNPNYQKLEIEINFHNMENPSPKERQAFFEYVSNQICLNKHPRFWLNVRTKRKEYHNERHSDWYKYRGYIPPKDTNNVEVSILEVTYEYDSKYDRHYITPKKK